MTETQKCLKVRWKHTLLCLRNVCPSEDHNSSNQSAALWSQGNFSFYLESAGAHCSRTRREYREIPWTYDHRMMHV